MIEIKSFIIDGKKETGFSNNLHPVFSFVIENDDNLLKVDQIVLCVNNHEIDVSELTRYTYEFDDLEFEKEYLAKLVIQTSANVVSKELKFETPLEKWDSPFISDPTYTFKEKRVSPKVMSFKRIFSLKKDIKKARAYVTTFGVYNFYLNNQKINKEYLLPGFTSYKHQLQYQTFDITKDLKDDNELIVDVAGGWAVGSYVMTRKNRISEDKQSLSMKVVVEYVDGTKEIIYTDESWLVTTSTMYLEADLYDGENFDARKERDNFHSACVYNTKCRPNILSHYGTPIVKKCVLKPSYL